MSARALVEGVDGAPDHPAPDRAVAVEDPIGVAWICTIGTTPNGLAISSTTLNPLEVAPVLFACNRMIRSGRYWTASVVVSGFPPFDGGEDLPGTGIDINGNLFRRLHGRLGRPNMVGPHHHVGIAPQQGFAVGDTGQLIEIITDPIRPQSLEIGEAGDPQPFRQRGDSQPAVCWMPYVRGVARVRFSPRGTGTPTPACRCSTARGRRIFRHRLVELLKAECL